MFLSLLSDRADGVYERLAQEPRHRLVLGDKIVVGWNKQLIERGDYFYAFSHIPYHQLRLPPKTFTIACFRDPIKRVLSHYNMLMEYATNNIQHPCMSVEGKWLGDSLQDFVDSVPDEHLLNQLYMFSKNFDVDEAGEAIRKVDHVFFTEDFNQGVAEINAKLGLNLMPTHMRKTSFKIDLPEEAISRLRDRLDKEYQLVDRLREWQQN